MDVNFGAFVSLYSPVRQCICATSAHLSPLLRMDAERSDCGRNAISSDENCDLKPIT